MKRALLFLIPLVALGLAGRARAAEPTGSINAEPNPCRIKPGEKECASHITWTTQNVAHARVIVKSEGKDEKEHQFSASVACEAHRCPAPWIRPDTRYVFKLYDFSGGTMGRELSQVTVTAVKQK